MTREYWNGHHRVEGLITENSHVARLIIRSFEEPEVPLERYVPYILWKNYLTACQFQEEIRRRRQQQLLLIRP